MGKQDSSPEKEITAIGSSTKSSYLDNANLKRLPNHLKKFIIDQKYNEYTPINHAVWRYIMRQNYSYLKDHAHESYVEGLIKTGISIDHIPSIEQMNEALGKMGWAAVTVDGFIPPAAFMEFQAYNVLVIAADIRQLENIEYTPAPDIVHEAAGHAPIIADPKYADYLHRIGEIGSKAMSSKKDFELYEAIRHLSIIKEMPGYDRREILKAEKDVEMKQDNLGEPSEMALLSRLHWWTVEYGLIGDINNPKIYGAGLLSSIGESSSCLENGVKKIEYNLDTADYAFDITNKQPQLFVTPDFDNLTEVLNQFASGMAFQTGGLEGINKAIECKNISTIVYSSGLQVSGWIKTVLCDGDNQPIYINSEAPTALAYNNKQIEGHGKDYHKDGFGSPIGKLVGIDKPIEAMTNEELYKNNITVGNQTELNFENGIILTGMLLDIACINENIVLMTFENCTVKYGEKILFDPQWGKFDMAVGENIMSVFCGAADKDAYDQDDLVPMERTIKSDYCDKERRLHALYNLVRECRNNKVDCKLIPEIWDELKNQYPDEWLLPLEMLELLISKEAKHPLTLEINSYLFEMAKTNDKYSKLIYDGLSLLD